MSRDLLRRGSDGPILIVEDSGEDFAATHYWFEVALLPGGTDRV